MSQATRTSSTGSAVRETRMVSPMPSESRAPNAIALLTVPCRVVPASVTPMCRGTCGSACDRRRLTSMVSCTPCTLADKTKFVKPRPSKCATNDSALATSLSASVRSSRSSYSLASEPAFTPMRMAQPACAAASITASTRSKDPMLPGLMRTAAAPDSMAAMASL